MYRELKVHCENPDCQRVIEDGEAYYECQCGSVLRNMCEECFEQYADDAWSDFNNREKSEALGCEMRFA